MALSTLVALAALAAAGSVLIALRRRLPCPPGPPSAFLLGVAKIHPRIEFWKTYAQWGKQYGDDGTISFHVMGRRTVVINNADVADDLLLKRSAIYSDRSFPTMAGKLMKREKSMFYISYNERFKTYRRLMHQALSPQATKNYWPLIQHEALILVQSLCRTPEELFGHLRRVAGAVTMKLAYGYTIEGDNDHFIAIAEESMRVASLAGAPGRWIVDSIPILRFLPDWFPGAQFKRQAKAWSHQLYTQSLEPHEFVKREIAAGRAYPSFTAKLLNPVDGPPPDADMEDIILWTAGAIYAAGADTTVSVMKSFFFLMITHPAVQEKARAEIDALMARTQRLPTPADRPSLPYLSCVLLEVMRWAPPSPLGLFHATARDDVYHNWCIPRGTTVIANIWAMAHNEHVYPKPFEFDPERYAALAAAGGVNGSGVSLENDNDDKSGENASVHLRHRTDLNAKGDHDAWTSQRDPREIVFGFGRRICTGQHIAEASLFAQMALVLATLKLEKAVDEAGQVIEPEAAYTTAIVSHIKPFPCKIIPRSERAVQMIEEALQASSEI